MTKKSKPWRLVLSTPGGPVHVPCSSRPAAIREVDVQKARARSGASRVSRIRIEQWDATGNHWVFYGPAWSKSDDNDETPEK